MTARSQIYKNASPVRQTGSKCNLILQKCLAIQLHKTGVVGYQSGSPGRSTEAADYWMYDNGYLLFQGFLEANSKCFWNLSLLEAMKELQFEGYVSQGTLLVRGSPCALEVLRSAWSRNVLKAPTNYSIALVGDIEDCLVSLISQGQFTPLPEALCWVILELTSSGQHAVLDSIRNCLHLSFPDIEKPSSQVVYDTLAKLMADKKIYQTSQGYFIVTPETRRLRPQKPSDASPLAKKTHRRSYSDIRDENRTKSLLMTNEEALTYVHGEMTTIRDGDVTHQSIQTNLADVICGGNPNDKILYASVPKRSTSFPLERRNSLKLFGSNKRLNSTLTRSGSMKYIPHKSGTILTDSSSSTECASQEYQPISTKKTSLLARLFRRSGRKRGLSAPPTIRTFSAQFPPTEWFNPKVIHMHCVGTQTKAQDLSPDNQMIQWETEPTARYSTPRVNTKSPRRDSNQSSHIYQKPKHTDEKSSCNTDSLKRRQDVDRMRVLKTEHSSADRLSERSSYRQLYVPERSSRRSSISKSSKSLNRNYEFCLSDNNGSRIYEEIKNKSSDSFQKFQNSSGNINENIYTKIIDKKTRSNDGLLTETKIVKKEIVSSSPSTPKYKRKIEKRSSSLPRRKTSIASIQKPEGVTHTDFPYDEKLLKNEETPIRPNLTNRRSSSYENIHFDEDFMTKLSTKCDKSEEKRNKIGKEQKHSEHDSKFKAVTPTYHFDEMSHDMTSLTSSGYDTQTNSIVSTCEQVPYSLKINKNYINSTTPPPSLTITEDFDQQKTFLSKLSSGNSSRSISPYPAPVQKPVVNVSSNISVTTGNGNKNSLSVQVMTNPRSDNPEVYVSSKTDGSGTPTTTTRINDNNTQVFVQQKNSPVASLITLQNRNEGNFTPKLERFPSLYSPRELLKSGYGYDQVDFKPAQSEDSDLDGDGKIFSEFDIENISKNQEKCSIDKFIIDPEKDDYGLSHKPIPRYFNLEINKLCDILDSKLGKIESKKIVSKIPVMKNRGKVLDRPVSIDNSQLLCNNNESIMENDDYHEFPSLSDLSVNFKSIAAQNILNNISVTSVDTLVEVNMAANNVNDKTNPIVNVQTDFGII